MGQCRPSGLVDQGLRPRAGAGAEADTESIISCSPCCPRSRHPSQRWLKAALSPWCARRAVGWAWGFTLCCFPGALGILVLESQILSSQPAAPTSALAGCDLREATLAGLSFPICKMG